MPFKQIDILEATPEQRLAFATTFLNIDTAGKSDDDLLSLIMTANGESSLIFIDEADATPTVQDEAAAIGAQTTMPPAAAQNGRSMQGGSGAKDPLVTILIPYENRNGATYRSDVEVGVNGRIWLIKRGVNAPIPYRVFLALQNATQTNFDHIDEGYGNVNELSSDAPRFNFNVIVPASPEAIRQWHAENDGIEMG